VGQVSPHDFRINPEVDEQSPPNDAADDGKTHVILAIKLRKSGTNGKHPLLKKTHGVQLVPFEVERALVKIFAADSKKKIGTLEYRFAFSHRMYCCSGVRVSHVATLEWREWRRRNH
jgi:hypothetical protein